MTVLNACLLYINQALKVHLFSTYGLSLGAYNYIKIWKGSEIAFGKNSVKMIVD